MGSHTLDILDSRRRLGMSKPISVLLSKAGPSLRTLSSTNTRNVSNYFVTDNNNQILKANPGLRFKSGGWQEDNKKWGLLWTTESNNVPRLNSCYKQKLVRVTTKAGRL
eukprot:TRINITY_DN17248_c0_g1_i1.p1 TRINITY_DN17248_c0_g1~~TRINITY_DN17248_c0_g1_i1.p1  ORF type:complete len:109 (-),score=25.78 TRINITY_DN17248_c0_g1_i1:130-456(-)